MKCKWPILYCQIEFLAALAHYQLFEGAGEIEVL